MASDMVSQAGSIFDPTLLSRCISCGFGLPACPTYALTGDPTYALTGDETSSPRGRITLMRALESSTLPPDDPTLAEQASVCLGCRACEPVCPAGVQYGKLLEQWRDFQWTGRRRPLAVRFLIFAAERAGAHRIAWPAPRRAHSGGRVAALADARLLRAEPVPGGKQIGAGAGARTRRTQ